MRDAVVLTASSIGFHVNLQKLVRLTRGDIIVESEPGEGSVFKFSLVLPTSGQRGDLQKLALVMKRSSSGLGDERIRGIRVLLVDANPVRQVGFCKLSQLLKLNFFKIWVRVCPTLGATFISLQMSSYNVLAHLRVS